MKRMTRIAALHAAALCILAGSYGCGGDGSSTPPTVSSATVNNTALTAPANVALAATATPGDGTITKVEFFNGTEKLGEVTTAPYLFTWNNVAAGTYEIKVVATNTKGLSASKIVTVTVNDGGMVLIDGGTMTMGDNTPNSRTFPAHEVTLSDFYISKYELTFDEWDAYTKDTGKPDLADVNNAGRGKNPVYGIDWYDAVEYCNWKSAKEGLAPVYSIDTSTKDPKNIVSDSLDPKKWLVTADWSANGYRLPTEAEWEYAARGGKLSKGYKYAGSNNLKEVAWYGGKKAAAAITAGGAVLANFTSGNVTKMGDLRKVGSLKPNELGLHDMTGNVHEWIWDRYSASSGAHGKGPQTGYTNLEKVNPKGHATGFNRFIIRGGSSGGPSTCMPVSKRFAKPAVFSCLAAGLRLVRNR